MLEEAILIASLFSICCRCKRRFLNVVFVFVWLTQYVWYIFLLDTIVELLVSHERVCISACWILLEAGFYVLVAFHLTSLF